MFLLRHLRPLCRRLISATKKTQVQTRKCSAVAENTSTYGYRGAGTYFKNDHLQARAIMFFVWYWILYGIMSEPEHLVGHHSYPKPSSWTDEELGIPPDDEE